jgi:predicted deacylase
VKKEVIYKIKSVYRQSMDITAYTFGSGEASCCILGALRGNEIQQMTICAQLVDMLKRLEKNNRLTEGKSITIIPCANYYSMNIGKRFWTMDNTDINRMFPGYESGETTQRIAYGIFKFIQNYKYGIQMASFYQQGEFLPHVKIMDTEGESLSSRETIASMADFGLPYGLIREPSPFDSVTLNYNWQIWGCQAFSMFAGYTDHIGRQPTQAAVNATLRFLNAKGLLEWHLHPGSHTRILNEKVIHNVKSHCAGIYKKRASTGDDVNDGDVLCEVIHPLEGYTVGNIISPVAGTVFFSHSKQLVMEHDDVYKIIPFTEL